MDSKRKKELLEEYRNRRPEMGIFSYRCKATGESFLGCSQDIKAAFNSTTVKLNSNFYPNKRLLELWNLYGQEGFELTVVKLLKYEDPHENYMDKLEAMREECLESDPLAKKLWK